MQIVMLTVELAHSHIHVCRSAQRWRALLCRKLQSLLIGTHCLAETTLRNPYIRQGDCATDCVRDVPGLLQTRHAIGIRPVRCLEIPARPGGKSQERRCRSAREMVILRCEVERPPGVFHGVGHIALSQGKCGTVHGDRTRQTAKFLFVHDDHLSRCARSRTLCQLSCPATVRRPAVGPQRPRARRYCNNAAGIVNAEHGPGAEQLVGERLQPAKQRGFLSTPGAWLALPVRSGPPLARNPPPPARGGSHRPPNHSARTTHSRVDAEQVPDRAAPSSSAYEEHRQKDGDSDTSGACHPAE